MAKKPDPPDPSHTIHLWLQYLHAEAGQPSYRTIAAQSSTSHTTVAQLLSGRRATGGTTWGVIASIAAALGASKDDLDEMRHVHAQAVAARPGRRNSRLLSGSRDHRPQEFTQRDCRRGELAALCTQMSAEGWKLAGLVPGGICTVLFSRPAGVPPLPRAE
jgi:hypothetical protein